MDCIATKTEINNAVLSVQEVTFLGSSEEIKKIYEAFLLLKKLEKEAHETIGVNEKNADWTMSNYKFNFKEGTIIVEIKQGSCG